MSHQSDIFDVLFSQEQMDEVIKEANLLLQSNKYLKQETQELNSLIDSLTRQISQHAKKIQESIDLPNKVKTLSKTVLQLSKIIIDTRKHRAELFLSNSNKSISSSQEVKPKETQHQQIQVCLEPIPKIKQIQHQHIQTCLEPIPKIKQIILQTKSIQANSLTESKNRGSQTTLDIQFQQKLQQSVKLQSSISSIRHQKQMTELNLRQSYAQADSCNVKLKQRETMILNLKSQIQHMKDEKEASRQQLQQKRIIKDWKLTSIQCSKIKDLILDTNNESILFLKNRIKQLQTQRQQYDYVFLNERNIIDECRRALQQKRKQLAVIEFDLAQKLSYVEHRQKQFEAKLSSQQKALESKYVQKVKQLKGFWSPQLGGDGVDDRVEQCSMQIRSLLQQKQKQEQVINFMNEVFQTIKHQNKITIENALDLQLTQFVSTLDQQNKSSKRTKLQEKKRELTAKINRKIQTINGYFKENKSQS